METVVNSKSIDLFFSYVAQNISSINLQVFCFSGVTSEQTSTIATEDVDVDDLE